MSDLSRREFLGTTAAAGICALCPRFLAAAAASEPLDLGPLSTFAKDDIYDTWRKQGFFIVRLQGKLYAPSATCTHEKETLVVAKDRKGLHCNEHNSDFTIAGKVAKGKPKKSLPRMAIALNDEQHVIVDCSRQFPEAQWNDPASFVVIK